MSADMPADSTTRLRHDKKLLRTFGLVATLLFVLALVGLLASKVPFTTAVSNSLAVSLGIVVYVCGIMEFLHTRKNSRLPKRRILKLFLIASLVLFVALLLLVAIVFTYPFQNVNLELPTQFGPAEIGGIVFGLLIGSAFTIALMALLAFGAVGLMSALTRRFTPGILDRVRGISGRKTWKDGVVAWIFGIPDTLDTASLAVTVPESQNDFPRKTFAQAVAWELILGVILAIYVAFNPLVVNRSPDSILRAFGMLGLAAILLPLVIVPWFIYTSVGATIRGMTKDFRLYDGIKSRIFRSYIAVGTLVVFVRASLSEAEVQTYVFGLTGYLVALVIASVFFTFIYFNYFDRELTKDIIEIYNRRLE